MYLCAVFREPPSGRAVQRRVSVGPAESFLGLLPAMKTLLLARFVFGLLLAALASVPVVAQNAAHLPIITAQPVPQTVREGSRVAFSVTVASPGELTYHWYHNSQLLNNGNSPLLAIAAARTSDAGSYHVEVSNSAGSVTSSAVTLRVNALPSAVASAPTITLHPTSLVVNNGGTAIFSVTASGEPVMEYQWMKNEVPVSGATSSTLALTGVKVTDAGTYTVRISNSFGSITSQPASLTVNVAVSLVLDR
jgi:hypothetical protein